MRTNRNKSTNVALEAGLTGFAIHQWSARGERVLRYPGTDDVSRNALSIRRGVRVASTNAALSRNGNSFCQSASGARVASAISAIRPGRKPTAETFCQSAAVLVWQARAPLSSRSRETVLSIRRGDHVASMNAAFSRIGNRVCQSASDVRVASANVAVSRQGN
jgi:hypothetical protein